MADLALRDLVDLAEGAATAAAADGVGEVHYGVDVPFEGLG